MVQGDLSTVAARKKVKKALNEFFYDLELGYESLTKRCYRTPNKETYR